jgi:hypothetical protein
VRKKSVPGQFVIVRPVAEDAGQWFGKVLDPRDSMLGGLYRPEDAELYVIVRCLEPGTARGLTEGDDYLVRAAFLHRVADSLGPAHSEADDGAAGADAAS